MSYMAEKIERLEAELADATLVQIQKNERIWELEAELAELRASSVVVRERCQTCDEIGGCPCGSPPENGEHPCPDCVDGWHLVDGVGRVVRYDEQGKHIEWVIPARLIEGDT